MLKLTLRTGPSTENKILAVIESGQQLALLEPGREWSRVRLPAQHKNLTVQAAELLEENKELKAENEKLRAEFETNAKEMHKTRTDYEALKAEAAEFLTLKSKYESAATRLAEQTARVQKLEEQLGELEMSSYIKWFLAGSGVLIVGFLIGFSTKRQRRRPALV